MFLTTGAINREYLNWRESLTAILKISDIEILEETKGLLSEYNIKTLFKTYSDTGKAIQQISVLPEKEKQDLCTKVNSIFKDNYKAIQFLNEKQIQELHSQGFSLGTHGDSHEPLTECASPTYELEGSKKQLQNIIDNPINSMAYPHSLVDDIVFDKTVGAGYQYIFGGRQVINTLSKDGGNEKFFGRINISQPYLVSTDNKLSKSELANYLFRLPNKNPVY